jgi:hypothetical protein
MLLRTLAKRCRRLSPLLAAPAALLLTQGEAKAILTYYIFENAGNVEVQAVGSLNLPNSFGTSSSICTSDPGGYIESGIALICTGPERSVYNKYNISGPSTYNGSVYEEPANSISGIFTILQGAVSFFGIANTYASGNAINSTATFNAKTLSGIGFTTTGLLGTWTLQPLDGSDTYNANDTIQVVIGAPPSPSTAVPGPLPLFGAAAAFGWSRRLRKRIAAPLTPLQA